MACGATISKNICDLSNVNTSNQKIRHPNYITMSTPLKTKGEALFEKAKDVIGDIWDTTTEKVEEIKDKTTEKLEELKDKVSDNMPANKVTAVKPLVSGKAKLNKAETGNQIKSKVTSAKVSAKEGGVVKKVAVKKVTAQKAKPATKKVAATK